MAPELHSYTSVLRILSQNRKDHEQMDCMTVLQALTISARVIHLIRVWQTRQNWVNLMTGERAPRHRDSQLWRHADNITKHTQTRVHTTHIN